MQHELITQWAIEKFNLSPDTQVYVEEETRSGGYCETCWYEYTEWEVYSYEGSKKVIHETFTDDFASILREVLDYSQSKINKA